MVEYINIITKKMDTALNNIRLLHQSGDLESAKAALEDLLQEEISRHPAFMALYGVVLLHSGKGEKAKEMIQESARKTPLTSVWASDLGFAHFLMGEPDQALKTLELAIALPCPDAAAYTRLGATRLVRSDLEGAEKAFKEAVLRDPERAEVHSNLGGIMVRLGKLNEALSHYERALSIKPDMAQAVSGRSALLVALERADEAILELEEKLDNDPDSPESINARRHLAHILDAANRFEEACASLREAANLDDENVEVLLQLAALLFGRDRFISALGALNRASQLEPESLHVLTLKARVYSEMGRHEKAVETVEKAINAHPDEPSCLITRAVVRSAADDFEGAEDDLRHALDELPGSADAWGSLGHTLLLTGRLDEAVDCLERAAKLNPAALASLIEARSFPEDPDVIERMVQFADNPLPAKSPRAAMGFALSRLFEKQEDYDRAFAHADQANLLIQQTISYDPENYHGLVRRLREIFIPETFEKFRKDGSPSKRPVFVVGMPRSGTTLTEQILCSHPDVFGAGELGFVPAITHLMPRVLKTKNPYPLCMHLFQKWMAGHGATYYLKKIVKMDDRSLRVVDKLPHNFLHLGLMAIIFPEATIIHVKRDFRDIAVSNYFTNFKHKHGGMGYAFDLCNIGRMINDYRRIMDHWRRVLPIPMFELQYEELVENYEDKTRELLQFVGLDWDDSIMDFHKTQRAVKTASAWQVRQPLYSSSKERWRKYEKFLGPLMETLEEY